MMPRRALFVAAFAAATPVLAQQPRALTADDYARAERFLGYNTNPLVSGAIVRPGWLAADRFWYLNTTAEGVEYVLVDPARRARTPAFDHARIATALSRAADSTYDARHLTLGALSFSTRLDSISFDARGRRWTCDVRGTGCGAAAPRDSAPRNAVLSPDGKRAAFIRDDNLWMRDLGTGRETPLTTDGVPDFGYATDNAGWVRSDRPVLLWSPDSKRI